MKKTKIFLFFTFIFLFSQVAYATFIFQDNTYKSALRVCNLSGQCEILYGSDLKNRTSSITNICYVSEVQNDKLNVDTFNEVTNNPAFYITLVIIFVCILTAFVYFKRVKND